MEGTENKGRMRKESLSDLINKVEAGKTRPGDLSFLDGCVEKTVVQKRGIKHLLRMHYENLYWLERGGPTASYGSFNSREEVVAYLKQQVAGVQSVMWVLGLDDMAVAVSVKVREDLRREREEQ